MEFLLHYVWQHRLWAGGAVTLTTPQGQAVEVVDTGVHNLQAGPDFFNAKVRIDGTLWAGNVEIHTRASDWFRHHHDVDAAYDNVILHVVADIDAEAVTADGKRPPQVSIQVPPAIEANYRELLAEETYPPCYRIVPHLSAITVRSWLSRLTVERLEQKSIRTADYLRRTGGDWERTFFITLARNFGFGTNADAFEQWAFTIDPQHVGKHRDDAFQVEAFFLGQAGLLADELVPEERRDDHFRRLQTEYAFLRHKFGLQPIRPQVWKFGRLRPQNFPHVRLSQLANLYHQRRADFSRLLEADGADALRELFRIEATPYWQEHYTFGCAGRRSTKTLQQSSLDLLLINTASTLLFAYGREQMDEDMAERAFDILERVHAERNYITRCWERAGIRVPTAADSQALIQLRTAYCDRKDCLRCRFGMEYLRGSRVQPASESE